MSTDSIATGEQPDDDSAIRSTQRPVDRAMDEKRLEKDAVRLLWLERVRYYRRLYPADDVPVYLTLSGGQGKDISLLVENDLIDMTEVGSIAETSQQLVIAVERNLPSVLNLQRQFPGLPILTQDFKDILRGDNPARFPTGGNQERACRARVINLDLQESLNVRENEGTNSFPVITWIEKLCILHALPPIKNWSLCLTLNATLRLSEGVTVEVQDFLAENFNRIPEFGDASHTLLGDDVFGDIVSGTAMEFSTLPADIQQKLLMVFVPKKITHLVHNRGWLVTTSENLYYGGTGGHAPMVTWVLDFTYDRRANANPNVVYREGLLAVLQAAGHIGEAGNIERVYTAE